MMMMMVVVVVMMAVMVINWIDDDDDYKDPRIMKSHGQGWTQKDRRLRHVTT